MAHFAKVEDGIVTDVIVVDNSDILDDDGNESETIGKAFCTNLLGGDWVQTSYSGAFRKNFAGIGDAYDETLDGFIQQKPDGCLSWVLNEATCIWEAPVSKPDDDELGHHEWEESTLSWVKWNWDEDTQSWVRQ